MKLDYSWSKVPDPLMGLFSNEITPAIKERFMREAVATALEAPTFPTVGAVIVKNGQIIARGYRDITFPSGTGYFVRTMHAEHVAIESANGEANGADIYTTLEPCHHRGARSGLVEILDPCATIIQRAGIKRAIIGLVDHKPEVIGVGIKKLLEHGIKVEFHYDGLEDQLKFLISNGKFIF